MFWALGSYVPFSGFCGCAGTLVGLLLSRCFAPGYHIVAPLGLLIIASTRVFYVKVKSKHRKSAFSARLG
jgi:hypothetical protein